MKNSLEIFRKDYLNAHTGTQRKDGAPLYILDKLTTSELIIAERELIDCVSLKDTWPIIGLGYIKSTESLPKLYDLLANGSGYMKIIIAHSIFQICMDEDIIEIVLNEIEKITDPYEIIDFLYLLPDFNDRKVDNCLYEFYKNGAYLVAYNAAIALGLSTNDVVERFKKKK